MDPKVAGSNPAGARKLGDMELKDEEDSNYWKICNDNCEKCPFKYSKYCINANRCVYLDNKWVRDEVQASISTTLFHDH